MDPNDYPTKLNLLQARQGLFLAKKGFNILDKKRQVLLAALNREKKRVAALRDEAGRVVGEAYASLALAHIEMGREAVARFSHGPFPLAGTCAALDEAFCAWQAAKKLLVLLYDAEVILHKLTLNIRKTQKRVAALGNITIPSYTARIVYIEAQLEERTRDELARLKLLQSVPKI